MGNSVNPIAFHVGHSRGWNDFWFVNKKDYAFVFSTILEIKIFLLYFFEGRYFYPTWYKKLWFRKEFNKLKWVYDFYFSHMEFIFTKGIIVVHSYFYWPFLYKTNRFLPFKYKKILKANMGYQKRSNKKGSWKRGAQNRWFYTKNNQILMKYRKKRHIRKIRKERFFSMDLVRWYIRTIARMNRSRRIKERVHQNNIMGQRGKKFHMPFPKELKRNYFRRYTKNKRISFFVETFLKKKHKLRKIIKNMKKTIILNKKEYEKYKKKK